MGFCAEQLARVRPLWERMLEHRFLRETRDGTIDPRTFATWLRQDYLFVEAAIPFIAALIPKAPAEDRATLAAVIGNLEKELELFRDRGAAVDVDLNDVRPAFTNHAYIQFLMATALLGSYAEGYTVLYAAEKAYHDSWLVVKSGLDPGSTWYPFVENWAGDGFARYVESLEERLDELAEGAGREERSRMVELFELTTRYEIAFWEMAATGAGWPGVGREVERELVP